VRVDSLVLVVEISDSPQGQETKQTGLTYLAPLILLPANAAGQGGGGAVIALEIHTAFAITAFARF
jgi:hypothetical protein